MVTASQSRDAAEVHGRSRTPAVVKTFLERELERNCLLDWRRRPSWPSTASVLVRH